MTQYRHVPVDDVPDTPSPHHVPVEDELTFEEVHGDMPWHEVLRVAMGRGLYDLGQGVKQNVLMLTDKERAEEYTDAVNADIRRYEQMSDRHPVKSFVGRIGGNAIPFLATAPVSVPGAAALGAIEGASMFTPEASFADKGINTALGGFFGASGQSLFNMFRNMPKPSTDEGVEALREAISRLHGLRPQNVSDNPTVQFVGDLADTEIIGSSTMARQAREARQIAQSEADKYADVDSFIDSARKRIQSDKDSQAEIYSVLDEMVQYGDKIDPAAIRNLSAELMQKQIDTGLPNNTIVKRLGRVFEAQPKENTFEYWKQLRTQVGNTMTKWNQGGRDTSDLKAVYAEITREMDRVVDDLGPGARAAWNDANAASSEIFRKQDSIVARHVSAEDETKLNNILFGGGAKTDNKVAAQQLFDALDNDGQEAARHRIMRFAMEEATDERGIFSPTAYARNLQKVENRASVFFDEQQAKDIKNLANLMAHISDPSQAKSLSQVLNLAMFSGAGGAAGATVAGPGGAAAGTMLGMAASQILPGALTRPRSVSAMLEALARAEPGSTTWNLIKQDLVKLADAAQQQQLLRTIGLDFLNSPTGVAQRAMGPASASAGIEFFGTADNEPMRITIDGSQANNR